MTQSEALDQALQHDADAVPVQRRAGLTAVRRQQIAVYLACPLIDVLVAPGGLLPQDRPAPGYVQELHRIPPRVPYQELKIPVSDTRKRGHDGGACTAVYEIPEGLEVGAEHLLLCGAEKVR